MRRVESSLFFICKRSPHPRGLRAPKCAFAQLNHQLRLPCSLPARKFNGSAVLRPQGSIRGGSVLSSHVAQGTVRSVIGRKHFGKPGKTPDWTFMHRLQALYVTRQNFQNLADSSVLPLQTQLRTSAQCRTPFATCKQASCKVTAVTEDWCQNASAAEFLPSSWIVWGEGGLLGPERYRLAPKPSISCHSPALPRHPPSLPGFAPGATLHARTFC